MIVWGVLSAATAGVNGFGGLLGIRVILGVAEGTFQHSNLFFWISDTSKQRLSSLVLSSICRPFTTRRNSVCEQPFSTLVRNLATLSVDFSLSASWSSMAHMASMGGVGSSLVRAPCCFLLSGLLTKSCSRRCCDCRSGHHIRFHPSIQPSRHTQTERSPKSLGPAQPATRAWFVRHQPWHLTRSRFHYGYHRS